MKRVSEPLRIYRAEMPQNRTSKPSGRIKWTDTMIEDLYECRRRAFEISSSDGGSNGERIGYMKIMKQLWEEKGYYALGLTAQNLRDTVARYDKKKKPSERSYVDASKEKNQIGTNIEQENGESIHPVVDEEICISNNSRENLESSQLVWRSIAAKIQSCYSTTNIATQHLIWTFNIQLCRIQHRNALKSTFNFDKSQ